MVIQHFTYRVVRSPTDRRYAASCPQFPTMSGLGASQHEALEQLVMLIEAATGFAAVGDPAPLPRQPPREGGEAGTGLPDWAVLKLALQANACFSQISLVWAPVVPRWRTRC